MGSGLIYLNDGSLSRRLKFCYYRCTCMDISYLGHSCFRLNNRDLSVVMDPYESDFVGFSLSRVSGDIVTVSHEHSDHNFADGVNGVKKVFDGAGEYEVSEVSFIGIPSFHDDKRGEERGKNTIFVVEMDGYRVVHLGDLGHKLTESTLNEIGEVDVLMVPVGGKYTIGPQEAVGVVQAIEPKIVIPMHFKTQKHKADVFGELTGLDDFVSALGLKPKEEGKLVLKKGSLLPEDQQLVVLSKK